MAISFLSRAVLATALACSLPTMVDAAVMPGAITTIDNPGIVAAADTATDWTQYLEFNLNNPGITAILYASGDAAAADSFNTAREWLTSALMALGLAALAGGMRRPTRTDQITSEISQ